MEIKVLVVDDDPVVAYLHKKMIQKSSLSAEPVICLSAMDAVKIIETENAMKQYAYLILLDINMPLMNGWEFLETLKDRNLTGNISVIIVSSSVNMADKQKAETYKEVMGYVEKPLTSQVFVNMKPVFSEIISGQ